jgi:hypothetical protein
MPQIAKRYEKALLKITSTTTTATTTTTAATFARPFPPFGSYSWDNAMILKIVSTKRGFYVVKYLWPNPLFNFEMKICHHSMYTHAVASRD